VQVASPPIAINPEPLAAALPIEADATDPLERWVDRQRTIHSPLKPLWFAIEAEIPSTPRIENIQAICAKHYRVSRLDILSARRTVNVVRPRQVAMYLAKTLTLKSLPEIGRRFGGRDHTTVLHAVRKITALRERDPELNEECAALEKQLRE
jgi:hypothetical protein